MTDTSLFYWLHETAASCFSGVDLGKGLDHHSLSRSADGTPYSSSDLLYFTLPLPFYLDKFFRVQLPFLFLPFWTKIFYSNSCSLFSSVKNVLSPTSNLQKYSKTNPNSVLAAKSFQFRKKNCKSHFLPDLQKIPLFCLFISYSCLRSLHEVH